MSLVVGVEVGFHAGQRFVLGHDGPVLPAGGVPADLPDDVARLRRVASEMDLAAHSLEAFGELLHQLRQSLEVGAPAPLELDAAGFKVEIREGCRTPSTQAGCGV